MSRKFTLAIADSEMELNGTPRELRDARPDTNAGLWDPLQPGTQYKAIDGQEPGWAGVFISPAGQWTLTYDSLSDPDPTVPKTAGLEPRVAVLVKFVHHDMAELERWYKEEHLKMLRAVPGWIRSWRYKLEDKSDVVLALHEYESDKSFESADLEATRSTEWTKRIVGAGGLMERRVFEVWKKQ
ncbi:hypothetical protein AURDEDRAFT_131034 [Auricularia subglabra TFB-10046 SS5]|uniref:ABM domain-containing protein n=1 Tax=Auricularia subglabra (strain TFB-10046 / SS5) TaxID=717982 RepID=J0LDI1_AURST|nr:hypothetical protein AURDEDRAFT_131034 [Auricularia subglabra TFB-10046 SS5]